MTRSFWRIQSRILVLCYTLIFAILFITVQPGPAFSINRQGMIELGAHLFHEPRLSGNNKISCATCHNPKYGYTDGLPLAIGSTGKELKRNTMTLLHAADQPSFYWDGRTGTMADLVLESIQSRNMMNQDLKTLVEELRRIPGYTILFSELYGTKVTVEGLQSALVAYLKTVVTRRAPFDRFIAGNKRAITFKAQRGMELFRGKGRCAMCHKGFNFTDSDFHNIGVPNLSGDPKDLGRFEVTGRKQDTGAFKTPTLRNIEQTGPYMHNGVFQTLGEVMEFYDRGGGRNRFLDRQMKPLRLTDQEKEELVLFMKTLTGEITAIQILPLP